jgi:hypothetical protein
LKSVLVIEFHQGNEAPEPQPKLSHRNPGLTGIQVGRSMNADNCLIFSNTILLMRKNSLDKAEENPP